MNQTASTTTSGISHARHDASQIALSDERSTGRMRLAGGCGDGATDSGSAALRCDVRAGLMRQSRKR